MLKATFLSKLVVEQVDNDTWMLLKDLLVEFEPGLDVVNSDKKIQYLTVPANFSTDFASVPRVPIVYTYVAGLGKRAGVVHDYLYHTNMVSKHTADLALEACLAANGVSAFRRWLMYSGVHIFGGSFYHTWRPPTITASIATEFPLDNQADREMTHSIDVHKEIITHKPGDGIVVTTGEQVKMQEAVTAGIVDALPAITDTVRSEINKP